MKLIPLASLALLALSGSPARGQLIAQRHPTGTTRLAVRPDSRLWIEGSSNLRDWSCEATTLDAAVDLSRARSSRAADGEGLGRLRSFQVRVPVNALKCGRTQMDHIMYKALRADDEPECRQIVGTFAVVSAETDGEYSLKTAGVLRVAGREQPVQLQVVVQERPDGTLRAQGTMPILMTDYGITPPTALFGVIRTENRILVKFDLVVEREPTVASIATGERH